MNCEELEPWISAYQEGELDTQRRRIVEAHLAGCPDCRALDHEWAAMAVDLRAGLCRWEAPGTLHARVMCRIPEREAAALSRARSRWPHGRLSLGLAPIAAAAAWLMLGSHPVRPPSDRVATEQSVESATTPSATGPTVQAVFPGDRSTRIGPKASPSVQPKAARDPKTDPASPPAAHPGRTQGQYDPAEDAVRRLRRLRPRRWRYRLAEYRPGDGLRRQRHHPWQILVSRPPEARLGAAPLAPAASPRISVVEYVLPMVQPPIAAPDAQAEFVLRPAQPVQVAEAGFDL